MTKLKTPLMLLIAFFVSFSVGYTIADIYNMYNEKTTDRFLISDIKHPYEGYYYCTFNEIVRDLDEKDGLEDDYKRLAFQYEVMWLQFRDLNAELEELEKKETRKPSKELLDKAQDETDKRMEKWFK